MQVFERRSKIAESFYERSLQFAHQSADISSLSASNYSKIRRYWSNSHDKRMTLSKRPANSSKLVALRRQYLKKSPLVIQTSQFEFEEVPNFRIRTP